MRYRRKLDARLFNSMKIQRLIDNQKKNISKNEMRDMKNQKNFIDLNKQINRIQLKQKQSKAVKGGTISLLQSKKE